MLFQLPILLPEKFPARSLKPEFLFALSFQRLKALSACFPRLSVILRASGRTWCEIRSRRSRN